MYVRNAVIFLAYSSLACTGIDPGMFELPSMVTPLCVMISSFFVSSQLPPFSDARSIMIEPGFIEFTILSGISFGAPKLIPESMVNSMKPGSIIMDLASENGGNCELTKKDEIITHNGVTIDGSSNIPGSMPVHASELYAKNITAFLTYMIEDGELKLNLDDEIISGSMYTHLGEITHEPTQEAIKR